MRLVLAALLVLSVAPSSADARMIHVVGGSSSQSNIQEFAGPFASWINAKTGAPVGGGSTLCTGAIGNGSSDDTAALQSCVNIIEATAAHPVLWLPAGTYKITATLVVGASTCAASPSTGAIYISMIGADPATTQLLWAGGSSGTMLCENGMAYSRINRLTFNGSSLAAVAIDQSWVGSGNYFDTENEYADDSFEGVGTGIRCGFQGAGCAETSVLRSNFVGMTAAGINMCNFNALDMFVWYSVFTNNVNGVSNRCGAGNYHVFDSNFFESSDSDITMGNVGVFGAYNNFSQNSNEFVVQHGSSNNILVLTVANNTILDATSTDAISGNSLGPLVAVGNTIRSSVSATAPVISMGGFAFGDTFSADNTYTTGTVSASCATGAPATASRCHESGDTVVSRGSINPSMPSLPGTPLNYGRAIFEETSGSSTSAIQSDINTAASLNTNAVVHFQAGNYSLSGTLTIPANEKIQIIGDGGGTMLTGSGSGAVFTCGGSTGSGNVCLATFSDFSCLGNTADCLDITNADQSGAIIYAEGVAVQGSVVGLYSDSLDYTNVELRDFYPSENNASGDIGLKVTGGSQAASGNWQGGATNVFSGAASGNDTTYSVSGGAHTLIRDAFYDLGAGGNHIANATGNHTVFSYLGSTLYLGNDPIVSLTSFAGGTAALVNLDSTESGSTTAHLAASGDGTAAQVAAIGVVGTAAAPFTDSTSPADTNIIWNNQTTFGAPGGQQTVQASESGLSVPANALTQILNTSPTVILTSRGAGVTEVQLSRVFVSGASGAGAVGIHVAH